jgi:hypothetical protein
MNVFPARLHVAPIFHRAATVDEGQTIDFEPVPADDPER